MRYIGVLLSQNSQQDAVLIVTPGSYKANIIITVRDVLKTGMHDPAQRVFFAD